MSEPVVREFSLYVDSYERHAQVQKIAVDTLMQMIKAEYGTDSVSSSLRARPLSVLEIGCGTGMLTRQLLEYFPESHFLCLDASKAMLLQLKKNLKGTLAPTTVKAKVVDCNRFGEFLFHPNCSADLIVSSFALQWLYDLPFAIKSMSSVLIPGGRFVLAIPGSRSFPEWRQACDLAEVPFTGNILPSHDHLHKIFAQLGFSGVLHESIVTQRFDSSRDFFKSIKLAGASKQLLLPGQSEVSLPANDFKRLVKAWDSLYSPGPVESSYQIVFAKMEKR